MVGKIESKGRELMAKFHWEFSFRKSGHIRHLFLSSLWAVFSGRKATLKADCVNSFQEAMAVIWDF